MKTLTIHASTNYPVNIGHAILQTLTLHDICRALNRRLVIITDTNLIHSHGKNLQHTLKNQGLDAELIAFNAGEIYKTRETKQQLEDSLLNKNYGRDTCLIALGGGVVTDLVGFLGATYCRGVPVIYIPTTLLAMVDASIGGKTAVNTSQGKNLIGTFTQPYAVLIDTSLLDTLPANEWHNGMAEIIKHSVIADKNIFTQLQTNFPRIKQTDFLIEMIYESCTIKKNIIEQDEKENNHRQLLNFGHTIGHAIETIEHHRISHGEAVAIGMLVESHLSELCGYFQKSERVALHKLLQDYSLPLKTSAFHEKNKILELMKLDKKSVRNQARFILLEKIGQPIFHSQCVDHALIDQALDWAATHFTSR